VIGTGTGLGVAALITAGDKLVPVQSEAGHMAFAPTTPDEKIFAQYCTSKGMHLDVESAAERARACSSRMKRCRAARSSPSPRTSPAASAATREHRGRPHVRRASRRFAGDLALAFGAWDGVFLSGAIARRSTRS
jgi:glucokinase